MQYCALCEKVSPGLSGVSMENVTTHLVDCHGFDWQSWMMAGQ